jgi:hypothetical protein
MEYVKGENPKTNMQNPVLKHDQMSISWFI